MAGRNDRRAREVTQDQVAPLAAHPRSGIHGWLDLLFPPRCAGCRRRGMWLCPTCLTTLEQPQPPLCSRCGSSGDNHDPCRRCQRYPPSFDTVWAAYRYTGALRPAIHHFKYAGQHGLAPVLGTLLTRALIAPPTIDLVVPVPLHEQRYRERGYNQSELLARAVIQHLQRPLSTQLVRLRPTPPQVGKDAHARRANVMGAFAWRGPDLTGRHIALVDDVCTTGATFSACADALRSANPASIKALALAHD